MLLSHLTTWFDNKSSEYCSQVNTLSLSYSMSPCMEKVHESCGSLLSGRVKHWGCNFFCAIKPCTVPKSVPEEKCYCVSGGYLVHCVHFVPGVRSNIFEQKALLYVLPNWLRYCWFSMGKYCTFWEPYRTSVHQNQGWSTGKYCSNVTLVTFQR